MVVDQDLEIKVSETKDLVLVVNASVRDKSLKLAIVGKNKLPFFDAHNSLGNQEECYSLHNLSISCYGNCEDIFIANQEDLSIQNCKNLKSDIDITEIPKPLFPIVEPVVYIFKFNDENGYQLVNSGIEYSINH